MRRHTHIKADHTGAKNGGGFWGRRAQAKRVSRRVRRGDDRRAIREQLGGR